MPSFSQLFGGGGLKGVQRGIAVASLDANFQMIINVSAVNPAKAVLSLLGVNGADSSSSLPAAHMPVLELISATQIRANFRGPTSSTRFGWQLEEFA